MFDWLKKKKPPTAEPQAATEITDPATVKTHKKSTIQYNPHLIAELKQDHRNLLKEYSAIITALEARNYPRIAELLDNFDEGLRAHLAREHVDLYIYLEYILARGTKSFEKMHDLRLEMDHISTAVMAFLNRYHNKPVDTENSVKFQQELEGIGSILSDRIQREEKSLYNLYREK